MKIYRLFIIGCMGVLVSGFVYSQYHTTQEYDSSSDGSEIAEESEQSIPPDVQQTIEQEKFSQTHPNPHVLGTHSVHVPILMYHYVEYVQDKNDKTRISLNTTPWTLENEIKTLANAGYTFMTNKELSDVFDGKTDLPSKPVVLTFDDGYRDFYTDAYPILKKYNAKATQYVISGFLGYRNHLLVNQLQEIARDGLVEIGAHTVHHVWLKGQATKRIMDEVLQSKVTLEKLIHQSVVSFAYPFGAFDQHALATVRSVGFESAVSTIPGDEQSQDYRYFLHRLRPGGRTGKVFLAWLESQK